MPLRKRVYHRETIPFTKKPLLAECLYTLSCWFKALNQEKG